MGEAVKDAKEVRLKAFFSSDIDVEIMVKIGTYRHPLSVAAAKELKRRLDEALRP